MILGLTAVAAVLVAGEALTARTTREALDAVRSMQNELEPLASGASAVLEKLVAYDRAVGEYVQARGTTDMRPVTAAGDALEQAVADYFSSSPTLAVTPVAAGLRAQITRHIGLLLQ